MNATGNIQNLLIPNATAILKKIENELNSVSPFQRRMTTFRGTFAGNNIDMKSLMEKQGEIENFRETLDLMIKLWERPNNSSNLGIVLTKTPNIAGITREELISQVKAEQTDLIQKYPTADRHELQIIATENVLIPLLSSLLMRKVQKYLNKSKDDEDAKNEKEKREDENMKSRIFSGIMKSSSLFSGGGRRKYGNYRRFDYGRFGRRSKSKLGENKTSGRQEISPGRSSQYPSCFDQSHAHPGKSKRHRF